MNSREHWEVVIVGAGMAGLSAAVYLGRALRRTLVIDNGRSLALWEPDVQNYLGFPEGVAGEELLRRGRSHAQRYGAEFVTDTVREARRASEGFVLSGEKRMYSASRLLLATGLYHVPPEIPGVDECLGHSMFFCKDCDAYRVQGRRIAIIGRNNEAVRYGLGMLLYSPCVMIATNGKPPNWDEQHAAWVAEYHLPVYSQPIVEVEHTRAQVKSLAFADGNRFAVDSVFTTRGDLYHSALAHGLGAQVDSEGQVLVDEDCRTTVAGLFSAGCVTPANCQMIIAAGQGATAAQAINRELFEESLRTHSLRQFRQNQLQAEQTTPELLDSWKKEFPHATNHGNPRGD
jgi:thioredoxin reductase (NADPH)